MRRMTYSNKSLILQIQKKVTSMPVNIYMVENAGEKGDDCKNCCIYNAEVHMYQHLYDLKMNENHSYTFLNAQSYLTFNENRKTTTLLQDDINTTFCFAVTLRIFVEVLQTAFVAEITFPVSYRIIQHLIRSHHHFGFDDKSHRISHSDIEKTCYKLWRIGRHSVFELMKEILIHD
jgi:hypothetical protein